MARGGVVLAGMVRRPAQHDLGALWRWKLLFVAVALPKKGAASVTTASGGCAVPVSYTHLTLPTILLV
eukprot:1236996-Amphidinium_carterae.1